MPPAHHTTWWYDCIPCINLILKKAVDDTTLGVKHSKQWSGKLFCNQSNIKAVDLVAMLGGVHLGANTALCMTDDPSQPLGPSW